MHHLADAYIHHFDPFAIRITETFGLRWYGLSYAAAFLFGWLLIRWLAKSNRSPLTPEGASDFVFYMIAGVLLGGRLGYAAFYNPALFVTFRGAMPFWDLLAIHEGGMSSHGGMIGVMVACALFMRKHRVSALHLLDMSAWVCPIGFGLGRLANFINGELWGKVLPEARQTYVPGATGTAPWWSIKYPGEPIDPEHAWTAQTPYLEERLSAVEAGVPAPDAGPDFLERLVVDAEQGGSAALELLVPQLTAHYPSQLIQSITEGPLIFIVLTLLWLAPRKPGVIGSCWLIGYGVLRILTEVFRQPDAALTLGLSRGQLLSVLMVIGGTMALTICARRPVTPMAGLRRPA